MTQKTKFLIYLIIYLITIFGVEFAYREVLYEKSVEYIETLKQEGFLKYFYFFWSVIYISGIVLVGVRITLLYYPINIFFCHVSYLLLSIFSMSILKSLYADPRPFWDIYLKREKEDLNKSNPTECDGEFGNPSGHAIFNLYSFFLWHLFINSDSLNKIENNLKKNLLKFLSLVIVLICMGFTAFSRIQRQMHSFNQILHGTAIGFAIFFAFCYIFKYNKYNLKDFIAILDKKKYITLITLITLYGISILFGLLLHNDNEEEYKKILKKYCDFDENDLFGKSTALISSIIFIVIGGYLGFLYMNHKNNVNKDYIENIINNWNKGKKLDTFLIFFFSFLIPGVLMIPLVAIPSSAYIIKFIICLICSFLYGFLSFGPIFCFACEKFKKPEDELIETS